jgi:hypothetical protein
LKELNKVFYYKYGRAKNFSALWKGLEGSEG